MSSSSAPLQSQKTSASTSGAMAIRARGRSFLALILSPEAPLEAWLKGLDEQMVRSVGFFSRQPIILDLDLLSADTVGLNTLQNELKERGIRLIGIEGGNRDWPALQEWDWPAELNGGRPSGPVTLPENTEDESSTVSDLKEPLIINGPVRSGQSVQNPDGDIIVLGAVSSGAEIIAGGSIHVYGPLRGRAIAGVDGRPRARIYAVRMEAELLAIDGFYMISEEIDPSWIGQAAQALLANDHITVRSLHSEHR
ncbi:septum site-determining protein MinC [Saccharibacter floricola]|nr:septum site-determining protein MinC [Saccharibacter floricola]